MASSKKSQKPIPKDDKLRAVEKALIQSVMFENGILPMEKTTLDMRRALSQLSPEESRQFKRKFRKMWRKAMRAQGDTTPAGTNKATRLKADLGVGKHVPSRAERNARKTLVFTYLWREVIEPLVERFERAGDDAPAADAKAKKKKA